MNLYKLACCMLASSICATSFNTTDAAFFSKKKQTATTDNTATLVSDQQPADESESSQIENSKKKSRLSKFKNLFRKKTEEEKQQKKAQKELEKKDKKELESYRKRERNQDNLAKHAPHLVNPYSNATNLYRLISNINSNLEATKRTMLGSDMLKISTVLIKTLDIKSSFPIHDLTSVYKKLMNGDKLTKADLEHSKKAASELDAIIHHKAKTGNRFIKEFKNWAAKYINAERLNNLYEEYIQPKAYTPDNEKVIDESEDVVNTQPLGTPEGLPPPSNFNKSTSSIDSPGPAATDDKPLGVSEGLPPPSNFNKTTSSVDSSGATTTDNKPLGVPKGLPPPPDFNKTEQDKTAIKSKPGVKSIDSNSTDDLATQLKMQGKQLKKVTRSPKVQEDNPNDITSILQKTMSKRRKDMKYDEETLANEQNSAEDDLWDD